MRDPKERHSSLTETELDKYIDQDPGKRANWAKESDRKRMAIACRAIRESKGLSREELARMAGYETADMITAIENANRAPAYEKIKDLANALDVSIEQLKAYGKLEVSDKGWPKLSESDKIALYVFGPILKSFDHEETQELLKAALRICRNSGKKPAWKQTGYQKKTNSEKRR